MPSEDTHPRPDQLEDRLDDLMEGGAEPPEPVGSGSPSTNPNESAAEQEDMAIADADHKQEPSQQFGGGQSGG